MTSYDERLHMFRMKMKEKGITHYFQKLSDPHITEYVHPYYKRIEWLCGFSGSNATIVVTQDSALLWTDPRYYLQGSKQLPPSWTLKRAYDLGVPSPSKFIASSGEFVLGLDTYTTSYSMISEIYDNNESVKLFDYDIFSDLNPSPLELTKVVEFNASFLSVKDKIDLIRKRYDKGTIVLTALDDVAWVFNIRGSDIPFTPVTYAFAIINPQGSYLFVGDKHQTEQIQQFKSFEGANVTVHSYNSFFKTFQQYITGPHLYYSEAYTNLHLLDMIVSYKEQMILKSELNYLQIQKSIRHPQEIKTLINLHNIDSLALCKFYAQIESMKGSTKTEWELCELLEDIRKEYEFYDGPSFESIIATGPNAAIIHYEPTSDKCSIVNWESTLLCDVGGQYKNGATTDVTRTVHFGTPTQKMKEAYTRVLQGHVDLQRLKFKKNETMRSLDHHARDSLKLSGWDYRHGTGHGVGFYLLVHECPPTFGYEMPFEEGMTISVEPGVYLENEFGIRIENVAYVIGDNADTFSFESFTRVPYCSKLIDSSLLSNEQKEWLNKYNANIREVILPLVADDLTKVWILDNTNTIE